MERKWDLILFDLDGTLTDPGEGITKSIQYALSFFGIRKDTEELKICIGPPLLDSFMQFYGLSEEDAKECLVRYRERYSQYVVIENKLYEGIPELLSALREQGYRIGLATSKPEVFARQVLEHFGLAVYFDSITGSELSGKRVQKWESVQEALHRAGDVPPQRAVMVGDRCFDVDGAAKCGEETVGVLWGYGSEQELKEAGARTVVASPRACLSYLLQR